MKNGTPGLAFKPFAKLFHPDRLPYRCAIVSDGDRLRPPLDDQTAMPPQPVEQQPVEEPTEPALSHTARTLLELQNDNLHVYLSDQTFEWDLVRHGNWEPCLKALELLKPRVAAQLRTAHAQSLPDIQAWALLDAIKKDKGVFAQALTQITADGDTLTAPPYLLDALHWIAVKT